jgi:hypothetical protein
MAMATTATRPRTETQIAEVVVSHQTSRWGAPLWSADEPVQLKKSRPGRPEMDLYLNALMQTTRQ